MKLPYGANEDDLVTFLRAQKYFMLKWFCYIEV